MSKVQGEGLKRRFTKRIEAETKVEIEKGVSILEPDFTSIRSKVYKKYPFHKMEVGDSFFIAVGEEGQERVELTTELRRQQSSLIAAAARRKGMKFVTRKMWDPKQERWGVRVWRVE